MTSKVIVVPLDAPLQDVAKLMAKHGIGSVIVVDNEKRNIAKGIVTEKDIIHKMIAKGKDPNHGTAAQIMSKPLRVVKADTTIEEAAKAMRENGVKRLPVIGKNDELVGIISEGDIMKIFPVVVDLLEERASVG